MAQAHIGRDWKNKYPTAEQQAEFFLLKFSNEADLDRQKVFTLKKQFEKFDKKSQGELEEDEAMQLLEARAETKTFRELRQTFSDIDIDQNHKLSFLEFACGTFNKSWAKLHAPSVDPEEIARAEALAGAAFREHAEKMAREQMARDLENQKQLEILRAAAEKASAENGVEAAQAAREALEAEIARQAAERAQKDQEEADYRKKREEEYQQKRAAELAQKGVAGKAALFKYAAEDTKDATKSNEERIKAEAAKRKAEKEAKIKAEEDKKKAEEETARAKVAAEEAAKKVIEAEEQAKVAAAEKAAAEAERLEAEKKAAEAEAERQKAMAGEEVARREREAYEAQKAAAEAEAAAKKAAEEAKRNEGRAKIAARAALWNAGAPSAVFDELNKGGVNLNKTATRENNSALQTAKLFAGIQKGAQLKPVEKPSDNLTEAQKAAFVEDRQQQPDA